MVHNVQRLVDVLTRRITRMSNQRSHYIKVMLAQDPHEVDESTNPSNGWQFPDLKPKGYWGDALEALLVFAEGGMYPSPLAIEELTQQLADLESDLRTPGKLTSDGDLANAQLDLKRIRRILAIVDSNRHQARDTRESKLNLPYFQTSRGLEYEARKQLKSEGLKSWDLTTEAIEQRANKIREDLRPRDLELTLNLEDAPSGGAPQVLFPTLRISTTSATISPNTAMLGLWRSYFNGELPLYFKFQVDLDNLVVVLTPALVYTRGLYKMTLGSLGGGTGFGPSIGFGQPLSKLMRAMEDLSIPDYNQRHQAAADRIFGRRRVYSLPNGRWAIRLTDPLV